MGAITKKYFIYFLLLLFYQWLMISSETEFNLIYSSIFVLLDKTIVDVAQDGIHFFDGQLNNEDTSLFVNFTDPLKSKDEIAKISITQFSKESGEYLLILCRRTIYIFDIKHNLISNFSIDESIPENNERIKYITAYKKENEYLHYLIRYNFNNFHNIQHYIFNLNNSNDENMLENPIHTKIINDNIYPKSAYCSFMTPLSSTNIDHDILNCFYVCSKDYKNFIISVSYDPNNDFNEIDSLKYNKSFNFWHGDGIFFGAITNEVKDKVLFYFIQISQYWGTFDYINKFSDFVPENNTQYLENNFYAHNLFYFRDTKEFIALSSFGNICQKFIMVFHSNLTINYKSILDFGYCWDRGPNNIIYNGNNYTIIYEDVRSRSKGNIYGAGITPINELRFIPLETPNTQTIPYNHDSNIITDKMTTTETTIITTEPTIITDEPTIITTELTITATEPTIITTEIAIITTEPTIITIEPAITTTEPTINILESSIITAEVELKNYTQNIKCKTSNFQSYIYDLCLECNIDKDYFPVEYPDNSFLNGFKECYNSTTKPINFYFDNENKTYKPCYETCLTCNKGGNGERHNCLSCDVNLRQEPDKNPTNCITECSYY